MTAEESFRVKATAMVGQSTRNIEARVIFEDRQNQQGAGQKHGQNPNQGSSENNTNG